MRKTKAKSQKNYGFWTRHLTGLRQICFQVLLQTSAVILCKSLHSSMSPFLIWANRGNSASASSVSRCFWLFVCFSLLSIPWSKLSLCLWVTQHESDMILLEVCAVFSSYNTGNQLTETETSIQTICPWGFSLHWILLWCIFSLIYFIPLGIFV